MGRKAYHIIMFSLALALTIVGTSSSCFSLHKAKDLHRCELSLPLQPSGAGNEVVPHGFPDFTTPPDVPVLAAVAELQPPAAPNVRPILDVPVSHSSARASPLR